MEIDKESLLAQVVEAADIEVIWEKPATGECGFISRQSYSSGGERPVIGNDRLSGIPTAFHAAVTAALGQVGEVVEFPYKQDDWFDHQWFEMRLLEERADSDGELIRVYYSRRIQASKQLELMLKEAIDAGRDNIVEENLKTGEARYLHKYSKNPDLLPQLAGERRVAALGEQAAEISDKLENVGQSVEFRSMLPGRDELDWVRQTNIRNFINEQGEACRLLLVKNISVEKQNALALEAAYERLKRSTHMGEVGTFTYDVSSDLFHLDETARVLLALPDRQFARVDSEALLTYVVDRSAKQLREAVSFQQQVKGTQTFELNVRGWEGIHRWIKLKFEFLDTSDGWQACGVLIDISDSTRYQQQIANQLRRFEEQERVVDSLIQTAKMALVEVDLESGMGELIQGESEHQRLGLSLSLDSLQRQIYQPEDYERVKLLRDSPGQTALLRTYDASGNELLYWAEVGYTKTYQREGRVYQLFYRRILDDIEHLTEEIRLITEQETRNKES